MGCNYRFCCIYPLSKLHVVSTTCEALLIFFTFIVFVISTTVVNMG